MSRNRNKNVRLVNQELEEINKRWLNKEIAIDELTHELIKYNKQEADLQSKKEVLYIIRNKLLLDANVESSHEKISNISLAFGPIMISYTAFFMSIFELNKLVIIIFAGLVLL